jgi:hypothetical protein
MQAKSFPTTITRGILYSALLLALIHSLIKLV